MVSPPACSFDHRVSADPEDVRNDPQRGLRPQATPAWKMEDEASWDHAAENNYGIPAFNVNNLEQVQAIMEAASETDSPVILQASRGARSYAGEIFLRHLRIRNTIYWHCGKNW